MPPYKDIADESEDERIRQIGEATTTGKIIAFITDDVPGKAERYIKKLTERFPGIVILDTTKGPVANTVTVRVTR